MKDFRAGSLAGYSGQNLPTAARLADTHTLVREFEAKDLEDAFWSSQAEVWSPNAEARPLILRLGLKHTSMSVGDVVEIVDTGECFVVVSVGFKPIGKRETTGGVIQ